MELAGSTNMRKFRLLPICSLDFYNKFNDTPFSSCGPKASKYFGNSKATSPARHPQKSLLHVHGVTQDDGAICFKNRKIIPYHRDSHNIRNGARLRPPSGRKKAPTYKRPGLHPRLWLLIVLILKLLERKFCDKQNSDLRLFEGCGAGCRV